MEASLGGAPHTSNSEAIRPFTPTRAKSGIKRIIANAGEGETQARKFYEKNGFEMKAEKTVETPWGNELRLLEYELRIA